MSTVPVHIQKRFEQRWASRFSPTSGALNAPKNIGPRGTQSTAGRRCGPEKEKPARGTGVHDRLSRIGAAS
ncbi:MAG: hypothetical protein JWP25_7243 [Bradyrhizobium sp.]|jgi:hypothetical protein|nr:hypothetical protein [Bradyrhizobium sp.]